MLNRRQFLGSILALAAAPAIVRASSLMKVPVRRPLSYWSDTARIDTILYQSAGIFDGATLTLYSGYADDVGDVERPLVSMPLKFRPAKDGVLRANQAWGTTIRTGAASMFRVMDAGANELMRGTVGGPDNWCDMILAHNSLVSGQQLRIDNFGLKMSTADHGSDIQLSNIQLSEKMRNAVLDGNIWR